MINYFIRLPSISDSILFCFVYYLKIKAKIKIDIFIYKILNSLFIKKGELK